MSGLLARLDDAINPIMVKELRQAVRSRFVTALLFLFLFAQLAIVALVLSSNQGSELRPGLGRDLFSVLHSAILFTCMVGLSVYTSVRLFAERGMEGLDLLYVTALSPRAIVRGKLSAAFVLTLLLYSASLPFVAFTYLLRGVGLGDIFLVLGLGLLAVMDGVALALASAALGGGRLLRVLAGLVALGFLLIGYGMVQVFLLMLLEPNALVALDLTVAIGLVLGGLVLGGWLYTLAVAMLSPPSANRARGPRIYGLAVLAITGGLLLVSDGLDSDWWEFWQWVWAIVVGIACLVASSGPERPSLRIARGIPRNPVRRLLAFPFTSGAAGGLLWAGLVTALLLTIATVGAGFRGLSSQIADETGEVAVFVLYCLAYALTAIFLRRTLLRRLGADKTWVLMLVLLAIGSAVVPILALVLIPNGQAENSPLWLITSPIAMTHHSATELTLIVAVSWTLLGLAVNARWLAGQWRAFRPLAAEAEAGDG